MNKTDAITPKLKSCRIHVNVNNNKNKTEPDKTDTIEITYLRHKTCFNL